MKLRTFVGKFLLNQDFEEIKIKYFHDGDYDTYSLDVVLYKDFILDSKVSEVRVSDGYLCIWLELKEE